jgi:hypothetical protein
MPENLSEKKFEDTDAEFEAATENDGRNRSCETGAVYSLETKEDRIKVIDEMLEKQELERNKLLDAEFFKKNAGKNKKLMGMAQIRAELKKNPISKPYGGSAERLEREKLRMQQNEQLRPKKPKFSLPKMLSVLDVFGWFNKGK